MRRQKDFFQQDQISAQNRGILLFYPEEENSGQAEESRVSSGFSVFYQALKNDLELQDGMTINFLYFKQNNHTSIVVKINVSTCMACLTVIPSGSVMLSPHWESAFPALTRKPGFPICLTLNSPGTLLC